MKAHIPTAHGTIEIDATDVKELFRQIAATQEVFGDHRCGACGEDRIAPRVRRVTKGKVEYEYFEICCNNPKCRAKLAFGQYQDGSGLFPVRKLDKDGQPDRENGSYGPHNGWSRYRGEHKD
jgi:hypothetical protein